MALVDPTQTAVDAKAVTPNDTVDLPDGCCRSIYVGNGGDVKVLTAWKSTVTFAAVPTGSYVRCSIRRVYETGTSAQAMLALY